MKLSDILVTGALVPQLEAATRDDAVRELVKALADAGAVAKAKTDQVTKAVLKREAQATTGIGKGVALPHARLDFIKKPVGVIGRSSDGIDFKSLDSKPVHSVILMLSNAADTDMHLEAMETIFKHVQRDMFRKFLLQSETEDAMIDLIREADEMV